MDFELHNSDIVWSAFGVALGLVFLIWWMINRKPPKPPVAPTGRSYNGHWCLL